MIIFSVPAPKSCSNECAVGTAMDQAMFKPHWSLCFRFKTLMTNKSEQDGDSSKTIEISDIKYHIFQVRGPQGCTLTESSLRSPSWACPSGHSVL